MTNATLARLGFKPDDRVVVLHADDVGMCHGANVAFLELSQHGLISSGSVMVPCPWFLEAAALAREHPELDLGVHLTLTSEWRTYRWGPISTRQRGSGLIDGEGCFWRRAPAVREHMNLAAAETEMRAQIEAALRAGIDVTHIDAHMGVAVMPELVASYVRLALEYRLPALFLRRPDDYAETLGLTQVDTARYHDLLNELEQQGIPLFDHFRISPGVPSGQHQATYRQMLAKLPAGLTYFSLHPNAPGDIETIIPERAFFRIDEYRLFQDPSFLAFVEEEGIHVIGFRQLRDLLRSRAATAF